MKKVIMIMVAVLAVNLVHAAAIIWSTGALYAPNADGSFSGTYASGTGTYLATVLFYSDAGGTTLVPGVTGNTDNSVNAFSHALNNTTSDSFGASTTYYASLFVTTADGNYTMETSLVQIDTPGTGNATINFSSSLPTEWTVVPEPTSMALLALSFVALGLRRRKSC